MESSTPANTESSTTRPSHTIEGRVSFKARQRQYALTCEKEAFEHYKDIVKYMTSRKKPNYYLVCAHDGPEYEHIHMYFQYDNPKNIDSKYLFGSHIETHVWSPQKYIEYCKGQDTKHKELGVTSVIIEEEGELRQSGGIKTIGEVKKMTPAEVDTLPAQLHNVANKIIEEEHSRQGFFDMLREIKEDRLNKTNIIYAHGPSGSGKTYGAYKYALARYEIEEIGRVSISNGFFKFDNPEAKCLIVEEFRSSQLPANSWLQFTDKYGYQCPIKGGYQYTRPETIIVCSIINPYRLYREERTEMNDQFIRRITEYYEVNPNHEWTLTKLDEI